MENLLVNYLEQLRPIPAADRKIITEHFTLKTFKEGEFLVKPDKIARELFFVCSGVIRIGSANHKGVELTHYFYNENHLVSILQSFNEEIETTAYIQASCNAEVLSISKDKLMHLYKELPYLKGLIDHQHQLNLINKVNMRNTYLGEEAQNRYKIFLAQHPDIVLRVSQKDIASYLGITPQSLSRIRKQMK